MSEILPGEPERNIEKNLFLKKSRFVEISGGINSDVSQKEHWTSATVRIEDADYERRYSLTCERRMANTYLNVLFIYR